MCSGCEWLVCGWFVVGWLFEAHQPPGVIKAVDGWSVFNHTKNLKDPIFFFLLQMFKTILKSYTFSMYMVLYGSGSGGGLVWLLCGRLDMVLWWI